MSLRMEAAIRAHRPHWAAAAATKAGDMKLNMVFAVVDTGGRLAYLERADLVQWGSVDVVAIHKAKASVQYKRPTLALEN